MVTSNQCQLTSELPDEIIDESEGPQMQGGCLRGLTGPVLNLVLPIADAAYAPLLGTL